MTLDPTGYTPKLADEWKDDIDQDQRANIDPALDQSANSPLGQLNGITAAALAELDGNILAVYRSAHVEFAEGESLDALVALNGVIRLSAAGSTVQLTLTGTNGTVIPIGSVVGSTITLHKYATEEEVTISGGTASVQARAIETGPQNDNSGTLTRIDTPISGWATSTNAADALPGRDIETDAELRLRRISLLATAGSATVDAIRADLLQVEDVSSVTIFENDTNTTDGDGVPAHAFEAVVVGGDDEDIAQAILEVKAAGILAHGTTTEVVQDEQGFDHTIKFSRPVTVQVQGAIEITEVDDTFPINGAELIANDIMEYINTLPVGGDVKLMKWVDIAFNTSGVVDVGTVVLGEYPGSLTAANVVIGSREKANLDGPQITVNIP